MLVWATEIPIQSGRTVSDLLSLSKRWIYGSPHNSWKASDFSDEPDGEFVDYTQEKESIRVIKFSENDTKWAGLRHIWSEGAERQWAAEIVGRERSSELLVSVQLHCDLYHPNHVKPKPRKPYIIRQLLEQLGGGLDGGLIVSDQPIVLAEAEVDRAVALITGESDNHLPVVYASATWEHQPAIDAYRLAQWTSGLAHVVVEPSRFFSFALARNVNYSNAYDGAVSIHWPHGGGRQVRFLPEHHESPSRLATVVADCLRQAMTHLRFTPDCTWDYIDELVSKQRIKALRETGSRELDEYISAFDSEIAAKDERINKAETEILRLRSELQLAAAASHTAAKGILNTGTEIPFYMGEIRDAVLTTLNLGRNQLFHDGRKRHIIDDLLSNNSFSNDQNHIEDLLKSSLNKAGEFGSQERKTLESIGFAVEDKDSKHINLKFQGDDRYSFTVQKTGSDWRGMKNLSSEICRKLFK